MSRPFPFSALVGLEDLQLALVLAALDHRIGGVLLRGEKGSAKTTAARGLASLLGGAPFVELPLGATEDRVVGSFDVRAALGTGEYRYRPGLLEAADGGVLYVDEVNLLADHLVDLLLDAAATGVVRTERDGVSETRPARFVLVGSMNPEEGELRPQLLDRFGLSVVVGAPPRPAERAEAVRRRLAFDADPDGVFAEWEGRDRALADRLAAARPAALGDGLVEQVAALCVEAGAEGLRSDLVVCRAAAALAGWEGRPEATMDDVLAVAPLALGHRRRSPWEPFEAPPPPAPSGAPPAPASTGTPSPDGPGSRADAPSDPPSDGPSDGPPEPPSDGPPDAPPVTGTAGRRRGGRGVEAAQGRLVGTRVPTSEPGVLHAPGTLLAAAGRPRAPGPVRVETGDLREAVRHRTPSSLVVMAVDASGSMGVRRRLDAARAAVLALLVDAYQRRDRVALVTFRGAAADVVLRPTGSTEIARARLASMPTGGRTPLAAGIRAGLALASSRRHVTDRPLLVVVSDGRATWAEPPDDPVAASLAAAAEVKASGIASLVVDCEPGSGTARLGLAAPLARAMGARRVPAADLSGEALADAVRAALRDLTAIG